MEAQPPKPIVIFSTQAWSNLWVSKHWIAAELSKSRKVIFVEPPTHSSFKNVFVFTPHAPRRVRDNLFVLGLAWMPFPFRIPFFLRPLWRAPVRAQLKRGLDDLGISDFDVLLFDCHALPLIHPLVSRIGSLAYYAVDPVLGREDAWWPEAKTVRACDKVAAVTQRLATLLVAESGRADIQVIPHGVDLTERTSNDDMGDRPSWIETLPKGPVIGYTGAVHEKYVDIALLESVAKAKPEWTFIFVGPYSGSALSSKKANIHELQRLSNVVFVGEVPYAALRRVIQRFDVCIVPYTLGSDNQWERRSPFKILNYLAEGKPVVISNVPAAQDYADLVRVYSDENEFITEVDAALSDPDADRRSQARREFARTRDFPTILQMIYRLLEGNSVRRKALDGQVLAGASARDT